VTAGQSVAATLTLARGGGFGGDVALAATVAGGVPGVSARFEPATAAVGATQSTVTLVTTAATPAGEHTVTISGSGGGAIATTTVVLRVTAVVEQQPTPSIALTIAPSPVAVTAGGAAASADLALTRTNFTGGVALTATAPPGLTVTVPSGPVAGASAALTVQAAATVAAGDYPITVTGTGAGTGIGPAPATATFVARVAAAPPPLEPGVVTGVALDARGRPLANVMVMVKMVFNPNVVRARTGADGRYTVRGLPAGLSHQIWAWYEVEYGGRSYCSRLAMPTVGDYDAFVPSAAVTRDFRWQLTGRIPDAGNNFFGASVSLVLSFADYETLLQDGDDVELRLAPQGPLVDGSEGAVITRTLRFNRSGWASRLDDIPHGIYTATAARVRGGARTPLQVGRAGTGVLAPTTTVAWEPAHNPGSCGQVLGPDLHTFSLQLAGG
jgi:hypothetical protein